MSITDLESGQDGVIASVRGDRKIVQRLADLGVIPETLIHILNIAPFNGPIEVVVRGSKLAIGREIARNIF
ncbi:MAG: FeoA family protein, partial [Candidatus Bathyarchaeota archaeon]